MLLLGAFFPFQETKDEGEKKLQKRNNVDQKWWMLSFVRSHNPLKTYSSSPSILEENHVDVCLPG